MEEINIPHPIFLLLFLFSTGFGFLIYPAVTPDKKITVTVYNGVVTLKTNCNHIGDKFIFMNEQDTIRWEHDGENWNDLK